MKHTLLIWLSLFAFNATAVADAVGEMPIPNPRPEDPSVPLECTPDINPWGHPSACNCAENYDYDPTQGICKPEEEGSLTGVVPHVGSCKNANGNIRFNINRYQGGAAPFPELVVYAVSLEQNGHTRGEIVQTANGQYEVNNWPINVDFIERSKRLIARTGNQGRGSETYSVILSVNSVSGSSVKIRKRVTCESSWDYMRP